MADVIAPPPGELFSETNDNPVAILLTYGQARILLAGDAEAREEEHRRAVRTRGLKRSSKLETTKRSELRFRASHTEGGAQSLELSRSKQQMRAVWGLRLDPRYSP
jgi:hypothetical protein